MKMKPKQRSVNFILLIMVTVLLCVLSLVVQNPAQAAGKPDVIKVGLIGDFSGPYAPVVGQTRPGALDAWDYINTELGGVHGVKVKPVIKDMSGKVAIGLSQYNELISIKPKLHFIDTFITPLGEALRERYVEDDVIGFHAGAIVSLYPKANAYAYYALYPEQMGMILKWVKDNWKESRNPRIGIITWDTSYGRAILVKPFFDYLKKIGVDLAGKPQLFGIREVDITTQLMYLRTVKPDFLVANNGGGAGLALKKGLSEMGWDIPHLNTNGHDWGSIRLNPPVFEGDIVSIPVVSFDEKDDPSMKKIMKYFTKNKRKTNDQTGFYLYAWQNALIQQKVMTDVVSKHGWAGLTTKNLKTAINNIKNFRPLGGMTVVSYSDKRRTPGVSRIYKVIGGKMLPQTDFLEVPDMRPAKYR